MDTIRLDTEEMEKKSMNPARKWLQFESQGNNVVLPKCFECKMSCKYSMKNRII